MENIDKGFDWMRENYCNVDTLILFSNGALYFIYYKNKTPFTKDIIWDKKFIGYVTFSDIEKYSINHRVYKSNNIHVPLWQKDMLQSEYRKDKIFKLLNEI